MEQQWKWGGEFQIEFKREVEVEKLGERKWKEEKINLKNFFFEVFLFFFL